MRRRVCCRPARQSRAVSHVLLILLQAQCWFEAGAHEAEEEQHAKMDGKGLHLLLLSSAVPSASQHGRCPMPICLSPSSPDRAAVMAERGRMQGAMAHLAEESQREHNVRCCLWQFPFPVACLPLVACPLDSRPLLLQEHEQAMHRLLDYALALEQEVRSAGWL